jgi:hypothetical protein
MNLSTLNWLREGGFDLLVESFSSASLVVQIRGYTENEVVSHDHTPSTDRTLSSSVISITGSPIYLTARSSVSGIKRGQCYVRVSLRIEGVIVATLFAGYVDDTAAVAFPNGKIEGSVTGLGNIRVIVGTDPVAGAEWSETVPTGALWRVASAVSTLVCDATVINRTMHIIFDDGSNVVYRSTVNSNVLASQTAQCVFGISGAPGVTTGVSPHGFIPQEMRLPAAFRVRSSTVGLQAGDNFSEPVLMVEEWLQT